MKDGMGTFVHTYRVHQKPPTFRLYSHVVYRLGPNLTFMAHPSPVPEQSSSWLINRDGPGRGGLHCSGLNKFFLGKNSWRCSSKTNPWTNLFFLIVPLLESCQNWFCQFRSQFLSLALYPRRESSERDWPRFCHRDYATCTFTSRVQRQKTGKESDMKSPTAMFSFDLDFR